MTELIFTPDGYINPWIPMLIVPAVIGCAAGMFLRGRTAILVGATVSWCGLLAVLLWFEYVQPPQTGGASMWPIAQLVGGTVAASVGGFCAQGASHLRSRRAAG